MAMSEFHQDFDHVKHASRRQGEDVLSWRKGMAGEHKSHSIRWAEGMANEDPVKSKGWPEGYDK